MSTQLGQAEPKPKAQTAGEPEIPSKMEDLRGAITLLEDRIGDIDNRFSYVMEEDAPNTEEESPPVKTSLGGELQAAITRVHRARRHAEAIYERAEV